jgi:mRNA-degrading endonuclease RelE of RelBE toxin-antitoxin system
MEIMKTVVETSSFEKKSNKIWKATEKEDFIVWIAENYDSGDVISGSEGLRKVRWTYSGKGKRGGTRVIYFNYIEDGEVWLLDVYTKKEQENVTSSDIKKLKADTEKGETK